MKVRFLEDYTVKAVNGPSYRAGEVYDLPMPSAQHFMRKRRAELAPADDPGAQAAVTVDSKPPVQADGGGAKPLGTTKRGRPAKQAAIPASEVTDPTAGLDNVE